MILGLVGRPNTGKSTFFKAASLSDVLIANYPFATIKPNHGMGYVKIKDLAAEFGKVSNPREGYVKEGWRFVPVELYDVAGLVEGASEGKGLGNEFLNDLTGVDALIQVVDVSGETDAEGKPTERYYPGNDIKFIEKELDLWYLGILDKVWKKFSREVGLKKQEFDKAVAQQFSGLKVREEDVKSVLKKTGLDSEKASDWKKEELLMFASFLRKETKPIIIAANKIDGKNGRQNYERIKEDFDYPIVACFAEGELALKEADKSGLIDYVPGEGRFEIKGNLNEKQKTALEDIRKVLEENGSTGMQDILNKVVFDILGYVAVFPANERMTDSKGNVLPDCFLMPSNSTALDFAYRIHKDIGDNFVKAINLKTKKPVGKDYVLQHLDGLEILTK